VEIESEARGITNRETLATKIFFSKEVTKRERKREGKRRRSFKGAASAGMK